MIRRGELLDSSDNKGWGDFIYKLLSLIGERGESSQEPTGYKRMESPRITEFIRVLKEEGERLKNAIPELLEKDMGEEELLAVLFASFCALYVNAEENRGALLEFSIARRRYFDMWLEWYRHIFWDRRGDRQYLKKLEGFIAHAMSTLLSWSDDQVKEFVISFLNWYKLLGPYLDILRGKTFNESPIGRTIHTLEGDNSQLSPIGTWEEHWGAHNPDRLQWYKSLPSLGVPHVVLRWTGSGVNVQKSLGGMGASVRSKIDGIVNAYSNALANFHNVDSRWMVRSSLFDRLRLGFMGDDNDRSVPQSVTLVFLDQEQLNCLPKEISGFWVREVAGFGVIFTPPGVYGLSVAPHMLQQNALHELWHLIYANWHGGYNVIITGKKGHDFNSLPPQVVEPQLLYEGITNILTDRFTGASAPGYTTFSVNTIPENFFRTRIPTARELINASNKSHYLWGTIFSMFVLLVIASSLGRRNINDLQAWGDQVVNIMLKGSLANAVEFGVGGFRTLLAHQKNTEGLEYNPARDGTLYEVWFNRVFGRLAPRIRDLWDSHRYDFVRAYVLRLLVPLYDPRSKSREFSSLPIA